MASPQVQARASGSPYAADQVDQLTKQMSTLKVSAAPSGKYQVVVMTKEEQQKLSDFARQTMAERDEALKQMAYADQMKAAAQRKITEANRDIAVADRDIAAADRDIAAARQKAAAARQVQAESDTRRVNADKTFIASLDGMLSVLKKLPESTQRSQATLIASLVQEIAVLKMNPSQDGSRKQKLDDITNKAKVLFKK
jgi:hypothetical protein